MLHESSSYSMGYDTHLTLQRYAQREIPSHGASVMPPATLLAGLLLEQCKDLVLCHS